MGNLMMEKHKIILVPFPFDDFSELKVRPAICLTNSIVDFFRDRLKFNRVEPKQRLGLGCTF
jgi:hypothetical protein